jgi:hypothetical protein
MNPFLDYVNRCAKTFKFDKPFLYTGVLDAFAGPIAGLSHTAISLRVGSGRNMASVVTPGGSKRCAYGKLWVRNKSDPRTIALLESIKDASKAATPTVIAIPKDLIEAGYVGQTVLYHRQGQRSPEWNEPETR